MNETQKVIEEWAQEVLENLVNDDAWQEFVQAVLMSEGLHCVPPADEDSAESRLWWETYTALATQVLAVAIVKLRNFGVAPRQ